MFIFSRLHIDIFRRYCCAKNAEELISRPLSNFRVCDWTSEPRVYTKENVPTIERQRSGMDSSSGVKDYKDPIKAKETRSSQSISAISVPPSRPSVIYDVMPRRI